MYAILIIEDDVTFSLMLATWLEKKGFQVATSVSLKEAKAKLNTQTFDIVVSDLRLPDGESLELLEWKKEHALETPFIMMTNYAEIQSAVKAIKLGASDYIAKPINPSDLLNKINEILKIEKEIHQKQDKKKPLSTSLSDSEYIIGKSKASIQLHEHARLVAPTNMSVLITGASGTGKEYIARFIHEHSNRSNMPFVAVDCGAIPKDLATSEFFGHLKGSFTGAIDNKTGAFVAAHGGTLFLDEIGNLTYEIQIQLLRALQERKIKPIGSTQEVAIDIRFISATNEDLQLAIEKGEFREDLYHRINEFTLRIPGLKEREGDFPLFASFFLEQANRELNKSVKGFDDETMALLSDFPWPGNLRQLKNVIKYATLLSAGDLITSKDLPKDIVESKPLSTSALRNEEQEEALIIKALKDTSNNKTKAAQLLGIDRKTLYNKMKIYHIPH